MSVPLNRFISKPIDLFNILSNNQYRTVAIKHHHVAYSMSASSQIDFGFLVLSPVVDDILTTLLADFYRLICGL